MPVESMMLYNRSRPSNLNPDKICLGDPKPRRLIATFNKPLDLSVKAMGKIDREVAFTVDYVNNGALVEAPEIRS